MLRLEVARLDIRVVCCLCKCLMPVYVLFTALQNGMAYHVFVGYQNLVMTFGIVYAVINPLILPCSLVYALVGYFIWKHSVSVHSHDVPTQTVTHNQT